MIRKGARQLLTVAIEAEVNEFLTQHSQSHIEGDKARFVRNGYLPEREIQTGIGSVAIEVPRVRDRGFEKDGIHLQARMEDAADCILVIVGVTEQGDKEILAIEGGHRESKESWLMLLRNLKERGLTIAPKLAVGNGALGFWGALTEAYGETKHQRCWFHKIGNVLDKLPKSQQARAKKLLQDIWMAATREDADKAFIFFIKTYESKYFKATECLEKDKEELLAFYDFPAEHWTHIRTTNPIESTFATVRHRTYKSKGCFSRTTILTMVFKLCESAQTRWRKLRGFAYLGDVIVGIKFINGKRNDEQFNSVNGRETA